MEHPGTLLEMFHFYILFYKIVICLTFTFLNLPAGFQFLFVFIHGFICFMQKFLQIFVAF